jgi:hypothetical protein
MPLAFLLDDFVFGFDQLGAILQMEQTVTFKTQITGGRDSTYRRDFESGWLWTSRLILS